MDGKLRSENVEWFPSVARERPRLALGAVAALSAFALLAIVVGLRMEAVRVEGGAGPSASSPYFIATQSTADRPPATILPADNALTGAPSCPGNQIPWLVASFLPPSGAQPQAGASNPEAAFRSAYANVSEFTMYLWSVSEPVRGDDERVRTFIPVWIVAGSDTFLVHSPGYGPTTEANKDKWFAYPAKLVGCIVPTRPPSVPRPPRVPTP